MDLWLEQFHIFLLVLLRISALLVVAPIFGHRLYLGRAKIGLAIAVSLVVFPLVAEGGLPLPEGLFPYAFMLFREIVMGMVLGFAVLLLFVGVQFAGQLTGLQMGFGIVNVIDPQSQTQVSILAQFLNLLTILLLFTIDGHHAILQSLVRSFEVAPLGGIHFRGQVVEKLIGLSSQIFVLAIKLSAPVLLSLFMISAALGILARTVPQMNVFIVGFPVQMAVGLTVMIASLPLFHLLLVKAMRLLERDLFALIDLFT